MQGRPSKWGGSCSLKLGFVTELISVWKRVHASIVHHSTGAGMNESWKENRLALLCAWNISNKNTPL